MADIISEAEKHEFMMQWHWNCEPHEDGFNIYSHKNFPGKKYKLDRAYEVMKEEEKRFLSSVRIFENTQEGLEAAGEYLDSILRPEQHKKKEAAKALSELLGVKPENIEASLNNPGREG